MGHVAHVVVVFCQNSVVDGTADVPQDEEEVGHDVLFIPVDQTVGQVAPGLIPVITENKQVISQISSVILPVKTQTVGELWVVRFCEVDYYDQQGNCGDEDRWRPLFYYLGIRNNSEVLE